MKQITSFQWRGLGYIFLCLFLVIPLSSLRSQMVVPQGWENEDSLRFGLFDIHGTGYFWWNWYDNNIIYQANLIADSLGANFEEAFGGMEYKFSLFGKRKGYMSWGDFGIPGDTNQYFIVGDFSNLGNRIQQRIYYASPDNIPLQWDSGYYWRYNDINFNPYVKYHNNTYDSNSISLYTEYPRNDSIAALAYWTYSKTVPPDTTGLAVTNGNEGRVILGYSDNRRADQILVVNDTPKFFRWIKFDTAKTFSATLEFNIDIDSIDTSGGYVSHDSLPLVRFQILYKQGDTLDVNLNPGGGWSVLPFVPFKDANHVTNPGWYKIIDTIITKQIYDSLPPSWRREDITENGSLVHSGWHFKQLHVMLKDMPQSMKDLIKPTRNINLRSASGAGSGATWITSFQHPDLLVGVDTNLNTYKLHLIETRVLSTYRATVRVRSMTWQDTIADKFLYRKSEGDSSWSCNPDGSRGGYDEKVLEAVKQLYDSCAEYGTQMREVMYNDVNQYPYGPLATSGHAYTEYMLSKRGMHAHVREQDWAGAMAAQFYRERLSYDGKPPSMFENQENIFFSNYGNSAPTPSDIFPKDYVANAITVADSSPWLSVPQDTSVGLIIGRLDHSSGADTMKAYKLYTDLVGGLNREDNFAPKPYIPHLRASSRNALWRAKNKRFATESDIQGWGVFLRNNENTSLFSPHYIERPTTPEETQAMIYGSLANGIGAMSSAQAFDMGHIDYGGPGIAGVAFADNGGIGDTVQTVLVHNYNFGHRNQKRDPTHYPTPGANELDSGIAPYYIGYSNSFRAFKRAFSRINQIYDTNGYMKDYPFKRMTWLNAYSTSKSLSASIDKSDTAAYKTAFLKCIRTTLAKRWSRTSANGYQQYIDSTDGSGNLIVDSAHRTYVEVGLFRDNPNDTLKGYAAMVVNTRLWPSLRDVEDSIYYNQGLDSAKDRSKSTLGDIDTRKVWFKLDTMFFPPNFRSNYYVIRDLWHQDTTYLVHRDSAFGMYFKPGEARLLYIEKGVSIRTSPHALAAEFTFNNGRRVAEILGGRQSVVTYVSNGNLYVDYPGAGERFEGYSERSAGENIATGYQICLDSSGTCRRPSICAGMNDTAVGIVYWSSSGGGQIKIAYQKKPHDPWWFDTYSGVGAPFPDTTTTEGTGVTPVLTPYADVDTWKYTQFNDSIWWVAATYLNQGTKVSGIAALRFKVKSNGVQFINDNPMQMFVNDGVVDFTKLSAFPTMASRPLEKDNYPVRFAWQKKGTIYYDQYKDVAGAVTVKGGAFLVSSRLPSPCYNFHPSISIGCLQTIDKIGINDPPTNGGQYPMGKGPDLTYKLYDYVAWEAKIVSKYWNSGTHYWPVLRARTQYLQDWNKPKPSWGPYLVFKPKVDTSDFHWPIVSSGSRIDTLHKTQNPHDGNPMAFYDRLRVAWYDAAADTLEFAHYPSRWKRTCLTEAGAFPSLGQPTYPVINMMDSSTVPTSVAFIGLQPAPAGNSQVRIANGWFPQVAREFTQKNYAGFTIGFKAISDQVCAWNVWVVEHWRPYLVHNVGGATTTLGWAEFDMKDEEVFPDTWPVDSLPKVQFRSDTFTIAANDSVVVPRKVDTLDLAAIRSGLKDSNDYVMGKLVLRSWRDSSWIATIDSMVITLGAAVYPGYGLDSVYAKYKYPGGSPTDTAFIAIEVLRGDITDSLERGFIQWMQDENISAPAYKRAVGTKPLSSTKPEDNKLEIYPNPLNLTATVIFTGYEGCDAHIELFDLIGRKVLTLYDKEMVGSSLKLTLDGRTLQSGMYLLRAQCGNSVVTHKVELIK